MTAATATEALDAADMEKLPTCGWIVGRSDGTFEGPFAEFGPGLIEADLLHCLEPVFDPLEEVGEVYDIIAWERGKPSPWWTHRGIVTVIGERELRQAVWEQRPARMLATPADYVSAHGAGFVIIDWSADINRIIGEAAAIECATPALAERLSKMLVAQAMPRLAITSRHDLRRAA